MNTNKSTEIKLSEGFINHFIANMESKNLRDMCIWIEENTIKVEGIYVTPLKLRFKLLIFLRITKVNPTSIILAFEAKKLIGFASKIDFIMKSILKSFDFITMISQDELVLDLTKMSQISLIFNFVYIENIVIGNNEITIRLSAK